MPVTDEEELVDPRRVAAVGAKIVPAPPKLDFGFEMSSGASGGSSGGASGGPDGRVPAGDPSIGCRNMDSKPITGDQVGCGRN